LVGPYVDCLGSGFTGMFGKKVSRLMSAFTGC